MVILGVLLALSPTRDRCLPWCRHLVVDGSAASSSPGLGNAVEVLRPHRAKIRLPSEASESVYYLHRPTPLPCTCDHLLAVDLDCCVRRTNVRFVHYLGVFIYLSFANRDRRRRWRLSWTRFEARPRPKRRRKRKKTGRFWPTPSSTTRPTPSGRQGQNRDESSSGMYVSGLNILSCSGVPGVCVVHDRHETHHRHHPHQQ